MALEMLREAREDELAAQWEKRKAWFFALGVNGGNGKEHGNNYITGLYRYYNGLYRGLGLRV